MSITSVSICEHHFRESICEHHFRVSICEHHFTEISHFVHFCCILSLFYLNFLFVGHNTYLHCKKYIEDVILVSDEELINCMHQFYQRGLVVEPSGCAAMAALIGGHVPEDITGKKVVVFVTGGNITPSEIIGLLN